MTFPIRLSLRQARRLSIQGQLLSAPRPRSVEEVVRDLCMIQMDPTSAVARTERLVLFSRLGPRFRVADLERLLWQEYALFEYHAHILPTSDLAIHRHEMRRYPGDRYERHKYVTAWLAANAEFRRYVLRELRRRGPLRTRDIENRAADGWATGGWNDDGNDVPMMLELLWRKREVMIAGRDGQQRLWDLAERRLPMGGPRITQRDAARQILDRQLRARGVGTIKEFGWAFDGRPPGLERALKELVRDGVAVPAEVEGLAGKRFAHVDVLERPFRPRTVALSPFDDLVADRDRTHAVFGMFMRLEIYVPKAKRRWGYFVMPILHGDRLIGRFDPKFDRDTRLLRINSIYAEDGATASDGAAAAKAIKELATWLGASDITYTRKMPARWRPALRK